MIRNARTGLKATLLRLSRASLGLALGAAVAVPAAAQQQSPPASKVERLNRAPVSKEPLRVTLRKPVEATLDNGLTVLILEDHRLPLVNVQFNMSGAGPLFEPPELPGLAVFTAQMLREGTKTRSSLQISQEIDQLGAAVGANAGFGSSATLLTASGLSDNFEQWFALAADLLLNATFPDEELAKLKQRALVGLRQQRSNPNFLLSERFSRMVYGMYPASVRSATAESVNSLTSERMAEWRNERYAPQNSILGIAGDVDAKTLIPKLNKWLAAWKKTSLKEELPSPPEQVKSPRIAIVDRPGSVQTDMAIGNIAIDRRSPDYYAVYVMDSVVGAGASARLFLNLRENKGYTYGVYSNFTALKYPGPWQCGGSMRSEVTGDAMTEFLAELRRIRDEKVPAAELAEKKQSIVAGFALSLEQPTTQLNFAMTRKIYGFPVNYWDVYPDKIMAVTADDIQRVAQKYIPIDSLQVVAVGDASKIRSMLEKFGAIEVWDTDGKPAAKK